MKTITLLVCIAIFNSYVISQDIAQNAIELGGADDVDQLEDDPIDTLADIIESPVYWSFSKCGYNAALKRCIGGCTVIVNPLLETDRAAQSIAIESKCQQMTIFPPYSSKHCGCPSCSYNKKLKQCGGRCAGVQKCVPTTSDPNVSPICKCFDCGKPIRVGRRWTCEAKKCLGANMYCQLDIEIMLFQTTEYYALVCRCKEATGPTTTTTTTTTTTADTSQPCRLIKIESGGQVVTRCGGGCQAVLNQPTSCRQFSLYTPVTDKDCGCGFCFYSPETKTCVGSCGQMKTCIPTAKNTDNTLNCDCDTCDPPVANTDGALSCSGKQCGITSLYCTLDRQQTPTGEVIPFCACK